MGQMQQVWVMKFSFHSFFIHLQEQGFSGQTHLHSFKTTPAKITCIIYYLLYCTNATFLKRSCKLHTLLLCLMCLKHAAKILQLAVHTRCRNCAYTN